jgi:methionine-rich copper-binding protein CopC
VTRLLRGGVIAAFFLMLSNAMPVLAHAELEESDPADGETITTPYTLVATFSEEMGTDRTRIIVRNAADEEVARGGISENNASVMTVELPALEPGEYTAFWTAVTPDDNGVTRGEIHFNIAEAATPSPAPGPTIAPTPAPSPTGAGATASLNPAPTPAATPTGTNGSPAAGSSDILLALALAAAVLLGLGLYLFTRSRR